MTESDDESAPADVVRDASEIARRALALFGVTAIGLGAPRDQVIAWLQDAGLWEALTPKELAFVSTTELTSQQSINASWRSEALLMLLWALSKIDLLPAPNKQCDPAYFQEVLPPYSGETAHEFVAAARRRSDDQLITMADDVLRLHWAARDARINGRPIPENLDIGILQERHHAINWVIGYDGAPWDEITTDT